MIEKENLKMMTKLMKISVGLDRAGLSDTGLGTVAVAKSKFNQRLLSRMGSVDHGSSDQRTAKLKSKLQLVVKDPQAKEANTLSNIRSMHRAKMKRD